MVRPHRPFLAGARTDHTIPPPAAVFSKSYCPYCRATKSTLSELGAKFFVLELDQVGEFRPTYPTPCRADAVIDDGAELQAALGEISGQSTVPNIFIAKEHIGGNSDLQAKKSQLPSLLKAAGAV